MKDTLGQWVRGIICLAIFVTGYIYQDGREHYPNKGGDHAYYAREASIKKQIDSILSRKEDGKKPARRLNEDLYQNDIPIEDMIKKFWGSDLYL